MSVGKSRFRNFQELLNDGFTPVAVTGPNVNVGMLKGKEMYICFLADTQTDSDERQSKMLIAIEKGNDQVEVPNIPLYCVKAQ